MRISKSCFMLFISISSSQFLFLLYVMGEMVALLSMLKFTLLYCIDKFVSRSNISL